MGERADSLEKYHFIAFELNLFNVEPGNEVEDGHSQVMGGVIARGGGITVAVIAPLNEKSFKKCS